MEPFFWCFVFVTRVYIVLPNFWRERDRERAEKLKMLDRDDSFDKNNQELFNLLAVSSLICSRSRSRIKKLSGHIFFIENISPSVIHMNSV